MSINNLEAAKIHLKYCVDSKDAERVLEYFDADVIVHESDYSAPIRASRLASTGI